MRIRGVQVRAVTVTKARISQSLYPLTSDNKSVSIINTRAGDIPVCFAQRAVRKPGRMNDIGARDFPRGG
jgi:hypothetical protein